MESLLYDIVIIITKTNLHKEVEKYMQYRNFGKLNYKVSALGFGAMRLPTKNDKINESEAINIIRYAIDNGVNYVDTAWPYHSGESEIIVGKTLKDGYREKVKLATKLPSWLIKKYDDMDYYLKKQLEKLQTDYIDFYLLHALNRDHWNNYKMLNVFRWIEEKINEGKIKHIGFSFHAELDLFKEIVDEYNWDFCQIQYNYLDTNYQAGKEGLKYAASRGLAVIIMEPLRGGQLAAEPPASAKKIFKQSDFERTPADWALQWLWNQPEVSVVLSGMSTMQQVKENILSACNSGISSLSEEELAIINKLAEAYSGPIQCTRCNYCMPCPNGVDIPGNFYLYNLAHVYDDFNENKKKYFDEDKKARASACIECGKCEKACPQNLGIISLLKDVVVYFEEK